MVFPHRPRGYGPLEKLTAAALDTVAKPPGFLSKLPGDAALQRA
jgi:hypothetical protein